MLCIFHTEPIGFASKLLSASSVTWQNWFTISAVEGVLTVQRIGTQSKVICRPQETESELRFLDSREGEILIQFKSDLLLHMVPNRKN